MKGLQISKDLMVYLRKHNLETLKVHSIFRESLNLINDSNELITLFITNKNIGPMCAIVPIDPRVMQSLMVDDVVEIRDESLLFMRESIDIDFTGSDVWKPGIQVKKKKLGYQNLKENVETLKNIIDQDGETSGIVALIGVVDFTSDAVERVSQEPLNQYADFIEPRLIQLLNAVGQRNIHENKHLNEEKILEIIPKFIGFGPGLTPSTDDFLLGIIASMIYEAKVSEDDLEDVFKFTDQVFSLSKGKTTKVSEEMLRHGAKGKLPQHYRAVVQAMFYDVKTPLRRLCQGVLSSGSTSGTDFLFGVYCYAQLRLKWNREGGTIHDKSRCSKEYLL